jgi:Flp pilus assembly protein CpaB
VDILSAVRRTSDKDTYAQILLHDVLVLAADGFTGTPENGKAIMAATVTVAVKPQDALKLALAEQFGPLRLIIRKFNDDSRSDVDKITFENVTNGTVPTDEITEAAVPPMPPTPPTAIAVEPKPEPQPTPKAEPRPVEEPVVVAKASYTKHRVTIIRGDQITYQEYLLDEEGNVVEPGAANSAVPQVPMPQPVPQPVPQQKNGEP